MRVGFGYDVHRFSGERPLVLGGVVIPNHAGLDGHSDADVVLHALADAILGAAGKGDIGMHFPPEDETWRDADSVDLLTKALVIAGDHWRVVNVDLVVVAESPKLSPWREQIETTIARILACEQETVNLKATTNERLGFIGRGEGIAAMATVLLRDNRETG